MFDFLDKYDYLIIPYLAQIARVFLISFGALGVVSVFGRMLEVANSDRSRNVVAVISMVFLSFITGSFNWESVPLFTFEDVLSSFFYFLFGVIMYIAFCWRFYPRLDALLDKKVAPDDKNQEIEEEKRKADALLRKAKREEKKMIEERKKLDRKEKRLTKK